MSAPQAAPPEISAARRRVRRPRLDAGCAAHRAIFAHRQDWASRQNWRVKGRWSGCRFPQVQAARTFAPFDGPISLVGAAPRRRLSDAGVSGVSARGPPSAARNVVRGDGTV